MKIQSINPYNLDKIFEYNYLTKEEINLKIDKANIAQNHWKNTSFELRSKVLINTAKDLEENSEYYAKTITAEMGKTIVAAIAEVKKCAWVCRYYAEQAEELLKDEIIKTNASKSYITFRPLGVILAVMPWNYPFWQVFRFIAPAIMVGNAGLLKHASNVPQSAKHIEEILIKAGLPEGVFQNMWISSKDVPEIIKNPIVKATTLTGSELAGIEVAKTSASELKKSVLELGGSDPYIICSDADIQFAAEQCAKSRLLNNGQSCIGAKRFLVMADIYDEFLSKFCEEMEATTMGDPLEEKTTLGPMARVDLRDELHKQVMDSKKAGAKILTGGYIPEINGAFYPPTILTEIKKGMPAYSEELFGPVASVIKVSNIQEAIQIANDTSFGLGACIFSRDIQKAEQIAKNEIESGCCFINHFVSSDPRLPFGGIKRSGYGRELSEYGIKEFVNIKTISIK